MKQILDARDFVVLTRQDQQATRDGIITVVEQVALDSKEGDTVVIYYSGHGGLAQAIRARPGQRWHFQFFVLWDFYETSNLRGISDIKLSYCLLKLSEKTKSVIIILDCCHSALAARHPGPTPWALSGITFKGVDRYISLLCSIRRFTVPGRRSACCLVGRGWH